MSEQFKLQRLWKFGMDSTSNRSQEKDGRPEMGKMLDGWVSVYINKDW